MNEILRIEADQGTQAPLSSAVDLRAYADRTSKMRESADITKIAFALVRAQGAMENPPRNRAVQVRTQAGAYTFRYATLDKITEMTRRVLSENGLCVLQPIVSTERGPALVTRLLHESGQWMECEILMPPLGSNPQAFGSAVTYLRRYAVSAMLNISADEDDDANRATGNHAAEVASRNITVNCVAPGFIATAMTDVLPDEQKQKLTGAVPAGRLGDPGDIAAGVVYLASEQAGYVTGQTLHINGGMAMI